MNTIFWCDMHLAGRILPQGQVAQGEYARLVLSEEGQKMWLQHLISEHGSDMGGETWGVWLETDNASVRPGTPLFLDEVGVILRQCGVMANLSLKENLLLPFLYNTDVPALLRAEEALPEVAAFLDIADQLEQQAGECPSYMHRLISLGRCLLQKPSIIIAQDVHAGLSFEYLPRFCSLFAEAIKRLQSGLLYLSSSEQEVGDIDFDRCLKGAL